MRGHLDNVALLYTCGAFIFATTKNGKSPADYARETGHLELAQFMRDLAAEYDKFFDIFPREILLEIFTHLDYSDLMKVSL